MSSKNPQKKSSKKSPKKKPNGSGGHLPLLATPPTSRRVLMTYYTKGTITESGAGVGATYFFRANSVYDPDASGVGAVAVPYGTWATLYLNYKVHKSTMRTMCTYDGAAGSMGRVTIAPVNYQPVVPANAATWVMLPGAVSEVCADATDGGRNIVDMVNTVDIAKIAHITKGQFDNELEWSGQVGSNPARQTYWMLGFESVNSSSVGKLSFSVYVTYLVEWFNPVPMQ